MDLYMNVCVRWWHACFWLWHGRNRLIKMPCYATAQHNFWSNNFQSNKRWTNMAKWNEFLSIKLNTMWVFYMSFLAMELRNESKRKLEYLRYGKYHVKLNDGLIIYVKSKTKKVKDCVRVWLFYSRIMYVREWMFSAIYTGKMCSYSALAAHRACVRLTKIECSEPRGWVSCVYV